MNYEPRRHEMWKKIEEAQARNARRLAQSAAATRDSVVGLAKEHPLKLIGGAVALGAIAALIIPKRNRKVLGSKSTALVAMASRIITDYATGRRAAARSVRQSGQEKASELGESLKARAAGLLRQLDEAGAEIASLVHDLSSPRKQTPKGTKRRRSSK